MAVGLAAVGVALAGRRRAAVLIAVAVAILLVPVLISSSQAREHGYVWSGRDTLPFAVGLPLLAAAAAGRPLLSRFGPGRLRQAILLAALLAGVAQFGAFYEALRRYAVGTAGPIFGFVLHPSWRPAIGIVPALVLEVALALVGALWRARRPLRVRPRSRGRARRAGAARPRRRRPRDACPRARDGLAVASRRARGDDVAEVEIGAGKSARRGYGLEEVAIVPSRRTRDAADVDISWQLEAHKFALPLMAAAIDGVISPTTAKRIGDLGGIGVLNLEGLWTRYEDPTDLLAEIATLGPESATRRLQEIYAEPVKRTLLVERIREITIDRGVSCGAIRPQRAAEFADAILEAELEILVIQGTVVSAEHVSKGREPLNLKKFIRELDIPVVVGGCSSYQTALHLMRTGAAAILVGEGSGGLGPARDVLGIGAPQATAIADAAGARSRHLEETGVYVHVVADGGIERGGDLAKAIACGADAVMIGAPLAKANEAPGRRVPGVPRPRTRACRAAASSQMAQRHPRGDPARSGTGG